MAGPYGAVADQPQAQTPRLDPLAYARLSAEVRTLIGLDLAQYKPEQVWRRVHAFARSNGLADWAALTRRAREEPALRDRFRDMLTINVSEFFRNPEAWAYLHDRVLPALLRGRQQLRVWSAGCSIGCEPYSLAMLMRESYPAVRLDLLATDIDTTALERARAGRYTEPQMAGISAGRRTRFFARSDREWEVRPELRAPIRFARHDLLRDAAGSGHDLTICRNTVIYFTEAAKAELFGRLARSLRPGGVLFIGATETINDPTRLGLHSLGPSFYERVPG